MRGKGLRSFIKYSLLFCFFLSLFTFFCYENSTFDFLWNYGFSHALVRGEFPYLDFNTISTPLYMFIMSLGLRLWDNYLVFMIEQAFLCTIFFFLIFKYVGRKGWILLPIMAFPVFESFVGTYNFLAMLLLTYLFYLEDNDKNDIYIGIVLGLLIFTKQTIGGVVLIFNLLFIRSMKRGFKRLLGVFVPSILFLIYFLVTGSLNEFIDLCFFGLFDFGSSNGHFFNFYSIVSICIVIGVVFYYFKTRDLKCSYVLGSFFFAFPLFDSYHLNMFVAMTVMLFVKRLKVSDKYIRNVSILLTGLILFFNVLLKIGVYKQFEALDVDRFDYYLVQKKYKREMINVYDEYKKYDNAFMVSSRSMLYDVMSNKKITYFDVPLKGNYGYNGTSKMIKKVKSMHDVVFFIDIIRYENYVEGDQMDHHLLKYIIDNSKKIGSVDCYNIYYKK